MGSVMGSIMGSIMGSPYGFGDGFGDGVSLWVLLWGLLTCSVLVPAQWWRGCPVRLFTVALLEDNSVALGRLLEAFARRLRLPASTEVVELVKAQHAKAKQILTENSAKLHELAKYLYEKETITGQEFMEILEGGGAA